MKYCYTLFIACLFGGRTLAQSADVITLVKEGVALNNQKNYTAAIEKYKAALAIDSTYAPGNYQIAYSLNAAGKGLDGISYLQRVFKSKTVSTNLIRGAYLLAGSIYDQRGQVAKAVEKYKEGLRSKGNDKDSSSKVGYEALCYNASLAYFRTKNYAEAEKFSQLALVLNPQNAGSQRIYALVTFHQNKRANALLGLCRFLMLEPNTARSNEAFGNLQSILIGGQLKPEPGQSPFSVAEPAIKYNQAIAKALKPFATRRYASAGDLLAAQLSAVFVALQQATPPAHYDDFLVDHYINFFYKLSQTDNMPAFARFITQSKPESVAWIKANPKAMADLEAWVKTAEQIENKSQ